MVFEKAGQRLRLAELSCPEPGAGQVLIRVRACAVCRTDLHIKDGELKQPKLPLIPGHEIIGIVEEIGKGVNRFKPAIGSACPGWVGPVVPANFAYQAGRTCVTRHVSPATLSTAATRSMPSPTSVFVLPFRISTVIRKPRR